MNNLNIYFSKFMNLFLKISLSIITIASIIIFFVDIIDFTFGTIVFIIVTLIDLFLGYTIIISNFKHNKKVVLLLLLAAFTRLLWIIANNNTPNSDFKVVYDSALSVAHGNFDAFKGLSYIARFPHLTFLTLYMALMQLLFPNYNLLAMKLVHLSLGLISLFIIYLIVQDLFKNKKPSLLSLLIGSIFPPLVTYTPVFCSENIAIPFYLLSVYLFLKAIKNPKHCYSLIIFCSVSLAIGNLFRMVALVMLIAYIFYLILYYKNNLYKKILKILCIILPYFLIMVSTSNALQNINITEYPLWKGSEPKITNILKGTNINSLGMWNEEDASFVENNLGDYDILNKQCEEIIIQRLTTTNIFKLSLFYVAKLGSEWCIGDFSGALWTQKDMNNITFKIHYFGSMCFQIIYIVILLLSILGLFRNKSKNYPQLKLFSLIFCGYVCAYLITENQCRYGYIVSWIFIIFSIYGIQNSKFINLIASKKDY